MIKKRYTMLTIMLCIMSMVLLCFGLAACGNKTVKVTTSYDPTQGTVTIAPESEDGTYKKDTEITVTVTPNEGYALDTFKLSTENGNKTPNDEGKFVFKVQEDTTITVTFKSTVVPVESVTLDEDTLELEVGGRTEDASATLVATVNPDNATDKTVTWTSGDSTIATVEGGNVTALAVGETTITATAGGKSATCTVTVTQHTHTIDTEKGMQNDETSHWHVCKTCGEKMDEAAHSLKINDDKTKFECEQCEYEVAHTHDLDIVSAGQTGHKNVCKTEGCGYESAVTAHSLKINDGKTAFECEQCEYEEAHTHQTQLQNAGTEGHKTVCTTEGCGYESAVTAHSAKDDEYKKDADAGTHYQLCECGAHVNEATHVAKDSEWQHDEQNTKHFKLCVCGEHVEEDTHFASGYEYDTGDMTTGKHYKVCEECRLQFNIGTHQQSAKPQGGTNGHHYSCTVCSFVGADEPHSEPVDGKWTNDPSASGRHTHYYICSQCDMKVSESIGLTKDYSKPDGEYQGCSKCGFSELQRTHTLSFVADENEMHHAKCTNALCTYTTQSVSCKTAVDGEGHSTITWTEATDDPASGHIGKCACGNDIALEAHDKDGVDGTCSKCGYSGEHVCEDKEENGYYDGVCDVCGKNFNNTWTFDNGTIEKYNGSYLKVKIPEKIDGVSVTALVGDSNGTKGFSKNETIESVIIPESITSIGAYSFYGCSNLVSVCILAKADSIPTGTFQNCKKIKSIVLSETITSIHNNAFGITDKMATSVLQHVYYMGNEAQWSSLTLSGTAAKVLVADKVLYYNAGTTGTAQEWHWQVEGMIPQAGPWES